MSDAAVIAAQLDGFKGLNTGTFRFWDVLPVRPGDWLWRMTGANAKGNLVELHLVDGMGEKVGDPKTAATLSVWDPSGFKKTKDGFELAHASRVRFGDCDVHLEGAEL